VTSQWSLATSATAGRRSTSSPGGRSTQSEITFADTRRAPPVARLLAGLLVAVLLAAGGSEAGARAGAGAGYVVLQWPRCAPLCAHAPARGPRITAIYVSTHEAAHNVTVTIDAFAAGITGQSVIGEPCYETHHAPTQPGCVVTATTHGRRVGAGTWWLRFRAPVYERYQISNSSSHTLVRSYWFGVSIPIGRTSVEGSRQGFFRLALP
jgi:hypothetical protein